MYCDHSARLVILSPLEVPLAEASSMALARVTAKASGVGCSVAELVEMPCRDLKAVCLVAGLVEMPCHGWEAVCLVAGLAEIHCRDWEAVEAAGDIEWAWA